jgi:hypothetical protein
MSLSENKLETVHVVDPRVDLNSAAHHQYGVLSSGDDNNFRQFPSSSLSDSSIDWSSCNPPSRNTIINRRGFVNMNMQLTFIGQSGGAGQTLLQCAGLQPGVSGNNAYYDAPRANPISNLVFTETYTINGVPFTQNTGRFFRGLTRYHNDAMNQDTCQSMTPSMLDQFQTYADGAGFARDPLRGYGDNPLQCPRGGFIGVQVIRNDSTGNPGDTAIVNLIVTEPFHVSPFLFGEHEEEAGLIGVETFTVNYQLSGLGSGSFAGLIGSVWSHSTASPSTFTSASVHVQSASLYLNFISPDISQEIPPSMNYSYYQSNYLQTLTNVSSAPGDNNEYVMNTVTLSSIPNRIYVWVGPNDNLYNWTSSDVYFGITGVQIIFENRPVIMSQATQQDLYQMSVRNGCNESWRQWINDVGSVLCINFGNDFPLQPNQAPGLRGKFELQITVNATNLSPFTYSSQSLNVLVVSEGVCTISNGTAIQTLGVLNPNDVYAAKQAPGIKYKPGQNVYGGAPNWKGILNFFKKAARSALDIGKKVVPHLAPQYAPHLQAADTLASAVGIGRRAPARHHHAGGAMGGRALGRSRMMKMLAQM